MEPIINPMFFYLLSIVDNISRFFVWISIVGAAIIAIWGFILLMGADGKDERQNIKDHIKRIPKKLIIFSYMFCFWAAILIPTKATLIEMEVARNITYDRVEKAVEIGKDLKNTLKTDILDIIKAATKEQK